MGRLMSHADMVVAGSGGQVPQGEANGNALFMHQIAIVESHRDHSREKTENRK